MPSDRPLDETLDPWIPDAIDLMLRERITFLIASNIVGGLVTRMTPSEAEAYQRRPAFREQFERQARVFYEKEGSPDVATKARLVGEMRDSAQALAAAGRHKDAVDAKAQIAKILGYTSADTNINILDTLTGADLPALRERAAKKRDTVQ